MLAQHIDSLCDRQDNLDDLQNVVAESIVQLVHVLVLFYTLN